MQLFSTIKHFHYHTKIPRKIPKSPNKISCIINITYLTSNNEIYIYIYIYIYIFKKIVLNKSFRVKPPFHRSNNPIVENEIRYCMNVLRLE